MVIATHLVRNGFFTGFVAQFKQAFDALVSGNPGFVYTVEQTLSLAVKSTAIATLVGLPLGCALGVGRFRGRGVLLAIGNALTRVPPVVVGVVVILLITGKSPAGNYTPGPPFVESGPLAGFSWLAANRDIMAQSLLALPIIIALTATAVQRIEVGLLDQAKAFGATRRRRGLLALREARRSVIAAIIVATGVTITAIGALYVVQGDLRHGCNRAQYTRTYTACQGQSSLALTTLTDYQDQFPGTYSDADMLMGIFFVLAAGLTFMQQGGRSWVPGGQF